MSDDQDEPTIIGQQAMLPTQAVRGITDDDITNDDIASSATLPVGPAVVIRPRPLKVPAPPTSEQVQEASDLASIQDPKKAWKAILGIMTALSTGGVAVSQSGLMKVSFGTPSNPAGGQTGLCAPVEHCPTALEVQSLRDRLKGEKESRRQIASRLEDVEGRQRSLINKVEGGTQALGRGTHAIQGLKDVVQTLNLDARNRNISSTDSLKAGQKELEAELEEVAEDVAYIKKKVKRR